MAGSVFKSPGALKAIQQNAGPGDDYDYLVNYLVNGGGTDENLHYMDTGKKPNHPTFSGESLFASKDQPGGQWSQDQAGWTFTPSQNQIDTPGYLNKLQGYFNQEHGKGIDHVNLPEGMKPMIPPSKFSEPTLRKSLGLQLGLN